MESELYLSLEVVKSVIFFGVLFDEIGLDQEEPTTVWVDNLGTVCHIRHETGFSKTRHFRMRSHFLRQSMKEGAFRPEHCPTLEMPADVITKALDSHTLGNLLPLLMGSTTTRMRSRSHVLSGGV